MNQDAYLRGFVKAACFAGLPPAQLVQIIKEASAGTLPGALIGAIPGAAAGGYIAYDRALERKKEDPTYTGSPGGAASLGALLGGGAGGLFGAGAGSVGWEQGMHGARQQQANQLQELTDQYLGA